VLAAAGSRARRPPVGSASPSAAPRAVSAGRDHLARGTEAREAGDLAHARALLEQASSLLEKDADWEGYVRARNLLGGVIARQGDYEAGLAHLNATLATAREKLPPGHLELARNDYEIGTVFVTTGRTKEGLELLSRALALRQAAGGPPTSDVSDILVRMGVAHTDAGDDDKALALFDEAEAIERSRPGQPRLADVLIGKGTAAWGQGRYDQAIEHLEE